MAQIKPSYELREYQWEGVCFLRERAAALLADEMGLGKTVQAAVALDFELQNQPGRALVVVPASLQLNWVRELSRWSPHMVVRPVIGDQVDREAYYSLPIQVLVASYDQIRTDYRHFLTTAIRFAIVILDEAQRIKSADSETNLACCLIPRSRSWALTGTPIENEPADLVALFNFVSPGLLYEGLSRPDLHGRIKPFFLRRRKTEVLKELPPIIYQDLVLELTTSQRRSYDELRSRRGKRLSALGVPDLLALITSLKKLCNYNPEDGKSVKLAALSSILEGSSSQDHKTLVFSQYVETLKWLSTRLPVSSDLYHGGQTAEVRDIVLARFREEPGPRALLVSLRAGGVGLNIPEASTVVLFDRWWNPAVEDQAVHRAHRFGKREPLLVYRFVVADTIEERIRELLDNKRDLFARYIEAAPQADLGQISKKLLLQLLR